MIPTHNPLLAMLFGAKTAPTSPSVFVAQPGPRPLGGDPGAQGAAGSRAAEGAATARAITVIDETGVVTGPRAEALSRKLDRIVARAVEVEAREAERTQADIARGYRIRDDANLRMKHAAALATPAGERSFASRTDALDMASQFVERTQSLIEVTHSSSQFVGRFDAMLSGDVPMNGNAGDALNVRKASHEDRIAAERKNLDIQAAHLRSAFGVTMPTFHEAEDGTLSHVAYEVRHSQYGLLVSVDADGVMTKHGPDGQAERPQGQRVDRTV